MTRAPNRTTIWLFREMLTKNVMLEKLFEKFNNYLNEQGYKSKIHWLSVHNTPNQPN